MVSMAVLAAVRADHHKSTMYDPDGITAKQHCSAQRSHFTHEHGEPLGTWNPHRLPNGAHSTLERRPGGSYQRCPPYAVLGRRVQLPCVHLHRKGHGYVRKLLKRAADIRSKEVVRGQV